MQAIIGVVQAAIFVVQYLDDYTFDTGLYYSTIPRTSLGVWRFTHCEGCLLRAVEWWFL
jgi:hypothetical protein